jgi:hypothetical protein
MKSYINKLKKLYKNKTAYNKLLNDSKNIGILSGGSNPKFTVLLPTTLGNIAGLINTFIYSFICEFDNKTILSKAYLIDLSNESRIPMILNSKTSPNNIFTATVSDDNISPNKVYLIVFETNKKKNTRFYSPITFSTSYPYNIPINKISKQYPPDIPFKWYDDSTNLLITTYHNYGDTTDTMYKDTDSIFTPPYAIKLSVETNNYKLGFTCFVGLSTDNTISTTISGRSGIFCDCSTGRIYLRRTTPTVVTEDLDVFDGWSFGLNQNTFRLTLIEMNGYLFYGKDLNNLRGIDLSTKVDNNTRRLTIFQNTNRNIWNEWGNFFYNATCRWKLFSPELADPGP